MKRQPMNWIPTMHTNASLRATITDFLESTKVATQNWTHDKIETLANKDQA